MKKNYEAPVLTQVGQAEDVVMGIHDFGDDLGLVVAPDFEFELD